MVRALLGIQGWVRSDVLFVSETHLNRGKVEKLRRRFGFERMEVAESDGRSGGLVMFWDTSLGVSSTEVQPKFIDIRINESCEAFYGYTSVQKARCTPRPWRIPSEFCASSYVAFLQKALCLDFTINIILR